MFSFVLTACWIALGAASTDSAPTLWYKTAATEYWNGLPVGNGKIGAMAFGSAEKQRVALNHSQLWRAKHRRREGKPVAANLPAVREKFFAGNLAEAGMEANKQLSGQFNGLDAFAPAGEVILDFPAHANPSDYRRELDLSSGIARTSYRVGKRSYTVDVFAHASDGMMAIRLDSKNIDGSDEPGGFTGQVRLDRPKEVECEVREWSSHNFIGLEANFFEHRPFHLMAGFLTHNGGTVKESSRDQATFNLDNVESAFIIVNVDLSEEKASEILEQLLRDHPPQDYDWYKKFHVAKHQYIFKRTKIQLGGDDRSSIPTDERLDAYRKGSADPALEALYFQFGRYLLMCSSRPSNPPAHQQGIWQEAIDSPGDVGYDFTLATPMAYWLSAVAGLPECETPLWEFLEAVTESARKSAHDMYGCRGLYLPSRMDGIYKTEKNDPGRDEWIGAMGMLAEIAWRRYQLTGDREFLATKGYPALRDAATFYQDYLIPDPRPGSKWQGRTVPVPSQSPGNRFNGGSEPASLTIGATLDYELIRDALAHAAAASEILEVDPERREEWRLALRMLPPLQVGKYGQLQEWLADHDEVDPGHWHLAHLFAVYPGEQVNDKTPSFFEAARVSLDRRISHGASKSALATAWSIGLYARFKEAEKAEHQLHSLIANFSGPNLLAMENHRFHLGANVGGAAAMAELLLQSQGGVIRVLPALPSSWKTGSFTGLAAQGGFQVDAEWKDSKVRQVEIKSLAGADCRIPSPSPNAFAVTEMIEEKKTLLTPEWADGVLKFPTKAGGKYLIASQR